MKRNSKWSLRKDLLYGWIWTVDWKTETRANQIRSKDNMTECNKTKRRSSRWANSSLKTKVEVNQPFTVNVLCQMSKISKAIMHLSLWIRQISNSNELCKPAAWSKISLMKEKRPVSKNSTISCLGFRNLTRLGKSSFLFSKRAKWLDSALRNSFLKVGRLMFLLTLHKMMMWIRTKRFSAPGHKHVIAIYSLWRTGLPTIRKKCANLSRHGGFGHPTSKADFP